MCIKQKAGTKNEVADHLSGLCEKWVAFYFLHQNMYPFYIHSSVSVTFTVFKTWTLTKVYMTKIFKKLINKKKYLK